MKRRQALKLAGSALTATIATGTATAAEADFVYPATGTITSTYWDCRDDCNRYHRAIDIANDYGTDIHAARGGTAYTHYQPPYGCGYYLEVIHENGYRTLYCHLDDVFEVGDGETVYQGQHIGNMGNSGCDCGTHLHFEINRDGSQLNMPGNDGEWVTAGQDIPKDFPGIGGGGGYSWPYFSRGDESTDIYSVQFLLEEHGYALNYHDGIFGPETESHVEQFQGDHGLAVDGIVGPNTWSELIVGVYGPNDDPWWATYAVQHNLRYDHGYSIAVDGYYGPETEGAIESFQSASNITVDGLVGPETWQALVAQ